MKTSFSLVYIQTSKNTTNFFKSIVGPQLFENKDAAIDQIYEYISPDIVATHFKNLIKDFKELGIQEIVINKIDVEETLVQVKKALFEASTESKIKIINWYALTLNNEDMYFQWEIVEVPHKSFKEQIDKADSICIDGNFVRHFNLACIDSIENKENEYFEASMVNDDFNELNWSVSLDDVNRATYNEVSRLWNVGSLEIETINFA
jgi:hypothetical protein